MQTKLENERPQKRREKTTVNTYASKPSKKKQNKCHFPVSGNELHSFTSRLSLQMNDAQRRSETKY